jgi:hypothetical protein
LAKFHHPATLTALQQFRQAKSIHRHSSRASNPAWYREALDLDTQLHFRVDGISITAFFHQVSTNRWSPAPTLSAEIIQDPALLERYTDEVLSLARAERADGLGIILHLADEFATTELKPEFAHTSDLAEIRAAAFVNPTSIVADSSIPASEASWRVLPYPAAGAETIGTTITTSRRHTALLETFRRAGESANFPVATIALSSPIVTLLGLPHCVQPTRARPFVAVLQYPFFTVLAFFNPHADLQLIRTLQHRGTRLPPNIRHAIGTSNASLEFIDPDIFLIPLHAATEPALAADLSLTFPGSRIENLPMAATGLPPWAPEPAIATLGEIPRILNSQTFDILRTEKWAFQDFLPAGREELETFPSHQEMRLLRVFKLTRAALFLITAGTLSWFALNIATTLQQPEWAFDPANAAMVNQRLAMLTHERIESEHWNNLLEDRSKAWVAMEALARLFPAEMGVNVKSFLYTARPDTTVGQRTAGFTKEWKITGHAKEQSLEYLNTLNTREGIADQFNQVAQLTGSQAYHPDLGNRSLVVNVRTQENSAFRRGSATAEDGHDYPFSFDLTITQRFESTDPLAISVSKAP